MQMHPSRAHVYQISDGANNRQFFYIHIDTLYLIDFVENCIWRVPKLNTLICFDASSTGDRFIIIDHPHANESLCILRAYLPVTGAWNGDVTSETPPAPANSCRIIDG